MFDGMTDIVRQAIPGKRIRGEIDNAHQKRAIQ